MIDGSIIRVGLNEVCDATNVGFADEKELGVSLASGLLDVAVVGVSDCGTVGISD